MVPMHVTEAWISNNFPRRYMVCTYPCHKYILIALSLWLIVTTSKIIHTFIYLYIFQIISTLCEGINGRVATSWPMGNTWKSWMFQLWTSMPEPVPRPDPSDIVWYDYLPHIIDTCFWPKVLIYSHTGHIQTWAPRVRLFIDAILRYTCSECNLSDDILYMSDSYVTYHIHTAHDITWHGMT